MSSRPVVMKFGGTSVADAEALRRVAAITADRLQEQPVVVVSAMAGVTDRLVELTRLALADDLTAAAASIAALRTRHLGALEELGGDRDAEAALEQIFADLEALVRGIAAVGELTGRTHDAVVSFGERCSPWLARVALAHAGLKPVLVDARQVIVTDDQFTQALPLLEESKRQVTERLEPALAAGAVPVLGGFIGATRAGVTTTLGRGGSDFSASLLGALLQARRIEVWTDVDGMLTADPRVCTGAQRIKVISFQEAAELAYFGAKVLHPATLLPAMQTGIPVWVLNSRAWQAGPPDGERTGTLITTRAPRTRSPFKCISCKRRITLVDVVSTRMLQAHGFLKAIWDVFAQFRCPVDMVSTSEVSVSLTVADTTALPEIADELGRFADVRYEGRKAIVCLVGESLRDTPALAGSVFSALGDINIRMISQGASEINIGMVIDDDAVPRAMQLLHERFFSDLDPAIFAVPGATAHA
ncbi:MAG: lysine-sensitive aspartokinase 3 [Acidobacteria bacterium]|nr:MAG: lysine-sensitive aspartokinase 3 [Acidobacteriota bacterium]